MELKELLSKCNWYQVVEIANPLEYYYGEVRDVPEKLWTLTVEYVVAADTADCTGVEDVLLIYAI